MIDRATLLYAITGEVGWGRPITSRGQVFAQLWTFGPDPNPRFGAPSLGGVWLPLLKFSPDHIKRLTFK
jgi:hypothetical protein